MSRKPLVRASLTGLPLLRDEFKGPFDEMFNHVWNEFFSDFGGVKAFESKRAYPKVDVYRLDKDLVFEAAVPGMSKDQLLVSVEDGVLTIKGDSQLKLKETQESGDYVLGEPYIHELKRSAFVRRFTLPSELHIDSLEGAEAKLENGILEIRFLGVYDKEEPEVKTFNIDIK